MNEQLKIQRQQLQVAIHYATIIETCDNRIAAGSHVNYFTATRNEAIQKYADAIAEIINSSIDIAVEYETKKISDGLFDQLGAITNDYRIANNIPL